MKTTHHAIIGDHSEVTAWQFAYDKPIPIWIARKFHLTGGKNWQAISEGGEIIDANPTDWAVIIESNIIVLTNKEFKHLFRPII